MSMGLLYATTGMPTCGHLRVVGEDGALVGAVRVGRQEEHGAAAGLGGLLGPAAGLGAAVGGDARHDPRTVARGLDCGTDDPGALVGGEGLVLAEGAVRDDAVAAVGDQPGHVLGIGVVVDGEVFLERQGGGDHDAAPGAVGGPGGGVHLNGLSVMCDVL